MIQSDSALNLVSGFTPNMGASQPAHAALAYVVNFHGQHCVAFAPYVSQQLFDCPSIIKVPDAADYAFGLIEWRDQVIPLIHMASMLDSRIPLPEVMPTYCLILAYMNIDTNAISYGAIGVQNVPDTVYVTKDDRCGLADNQYVDQWKQLAVSCFWYKQRAVPIIDTNMLFNVI